MGTETPRLGVFVRNKLLLCVVYCLFGVFVRNKLLLCVVYCLFGFGKRYVGAIAGVPVKAVRDLGTGYDSNQPGKYVHT